MGVFLSEDDDLFKNMIIFGIFRIIIIIFEIIFKSVLILKKNQITNLSTKKKLKTKIKSCDDKATNFHNKEIPTVVVTTDSTFKNDENYYLQVFLKEYKYTEQ